MLVLKFGGSSVASARRILQVSEIVKSRHQKGPLVVVVSAFGGVTDDLLSAASKAATGDIGYKDVFNEIATRCHKIIAELDLQAVHEEIRISVSALLKDLEDVLRGIYLIRECSNKTSDLVVSFGERLSSQVVAGAFRQKNIETRLLDARDLIKTDSNFGKASVDFVQTDQLIQDTLNSFQKVAIAPGFIASNTQGHTTTLGRGGSDYTASIFAAALQADLLEIWTDVDGIMTADPRKVKNAIPVPVLSFEEAMELSHFGAKVIYPPSIQPVRIKGISAWIKNTFQPETLGSHIANTPDYKPQAICGISSIDHITLLNISGSGLVGVSGFASRLFASLAREGINIVLITQASSEHSISLAISPTQCERAVSAINLEFENEMESKLVDEVGVESELSVVALVGDSMPSRVGIAGKLFSTLGKNGVNVRAIAQGSSERNISVIISQKDTSKALNLLHDTFFMSQTQKANLFVVGVGNVGSTLLDQVKAQQKYLKETHQIEINVIGLANSRKFIIDPAGIDLDNWKETLNAGEKMSVKKFIDQMCAANMYNAIFIDNTATDSLPNFYTEILSNSISVVTPNKIACSSTYDHYRNLKSVAREYGVRFLFETNVGAGLPVIGTLNDLVRSGDRVKEIHAVLSGSLNYIFNHFKKGVAFHDVVRAAQEGGLTEPDPREDLFGQDVKRKILILVRESGYRMESDEILSEKFLPTACYEAESVDQFYHSLEKHASEIEELVNQAESRGEKLKFIASFKQGVAKIGLESIDEKHPFYHVYGKDNAVMFFTDRYSAQPLVIKGAGAGAEVTASGIFADIMRLVNV